MGAALLCSFAHAEVVPLDRVVAIVDNDVIMQSQLDQRLREVHQTLLKRGAPLPPEHVLTQQVLERLIIENIQQQIGDRSGIRISDEELNQAMGTIAQRNGMSLEQFQAALTRDGLSYADAREQVRREMVISRVRQRRVAERIQVSEQEVKNFLASDMGKIQLSEEYRLANILIPVPEAASSDVIQAAARQAQELYQQLKQGADFGQLAISRSAGDNALEGGEIGWRKAAQLPQPFDSMIGSLAVGDVTEPVRTPAASSSSSWKRSAAAARWSVTKCMSAISCSSPAKSAAKRRPRSWRRSCTSASSPGRTSANWRRASPKIRVPPSTAAT